MAGQVEPPLRAHFTEEGAARGLLPGPVAQGAEGRPILLTDVSSLPNPTFPWPGSIKGSSPPPTPATLHPQGWGWKSKRGPLLRVVGLGDWQTHLNLPRCCLLTGRRWANY